MADLTNEDALALASSLITIGHPFSPLAVQATALDLIEMCKGKVLGPGQILTPYEQAKKLIDRARSSWEEGWPERGGTRKLQLLFQEMFGKPEEWVPISYEETLARGLVRPPCGRCDDFGHVGTRPTIQFCTCREGRHLKAWEGDSVLLRLNTEPVERPNSKEIEALRRKLQ